MQKHKQLKLAEIKCFWFYCALLSNFSELLSAPNTHASKAIKTLHKLANFVTVDLSHDTEI